MDLVFVDVKRRSHLNSAQNSKSRNPDQKMFLYSNYRKKGNWKKRRIQPINVRKLVLPSDKVAMLEITPTER